MEITNLFNHFKNVGHAYLKWLKTSSLIYLTNKHLIFCMWLCIHKYIYIMKFIQMGVVSHAWVLPKVITMLNLQYVKTEVSSDADFYI